MPEMTGYRYIAEMLHGYGVTAVFHVPYVLDGALVEMEKLGILRVRCHSEKAAAYMADAYARVSRGPGIAMAQSVGAANLAAGLQDAWLAGSPVIAVTGRWMPTTSINKPTRRSITVHSTIRSRNSMPTSTTWNNCPSCCTRPSARPPRGRRARFTWISWELPVISRRLRNWMPR